MLITATEPTLLVWVRALLWCQIESVARERAREQDRVETHTISVMSLHPGPEQTGVLPAHLRNVRTRLSRR